MSLYHHQRELLKQYRLFPRSSRGWGQHFLTSGRVLDAIIRAAEIRPNATVLEIGPGLGVLTEALLATDARVVAIEQDRRWEKLLHDRFGINPRFQLIIANALNVSWTDAVGDRPYQIVANLPYAITTPVFEKMFTEPCVASSAVLLIQDDVTRRLMAQPGSSKRSALSAIAQLQWDIQRVMRVGRRDFFPAPRVDGAVIRCTPRSHRLSNDFVEFLHACFRHRRKRLASNLLYSISSLRGANLCERRSNLRSSTEIASPDLRLGRNDDERRLLSKEYIATTMASLNIPSNARAQELANEQWQRLYAVFVERSSLFLSPLGRGMG